MARFQRRWPESIPTRPEEFDAWLDQGYATLHVLDTELASRDYLVGERFSIADTLRDF
jgi:glutathione S-transferase